MLKMTNQDPSEFYITLPSDSSMDTYPNNTVTHFYTALANPIQLSGTWQVGLAEISFPHSWRTVKSNLKHFFWSVKIENRQHENVYELKDGLYRNPEEIVEEMNRTMTNNTPASSKHDLAFSFDQITRHVRFHFTGSQQRRPKDSDDESTAGGLFELTGLFEEPRRENARRRDRERDLITIPMTVKLNENLIQLLGFPSPLAGRDLSANTYIGTDIVDLNQGFHALYVYCDIVQPRHVGNILAPLLRTVAIDYNNLKKNYINTRIFNPVYFLALQKQSFSSIELDIRTDLGEPVPFESGKVLATLVFRQLSS